MNEIFTWAITVVVFTLFIAIPMATSIIGVLCSWVDRRANSFPYPAAYKLPWMSSKHLFHVKNHENWGEYLDSGDYSCAYFIGFILSAGAFFIDALRHDHPAFTYSVLGFIGTVGLLLFSVRAGVDLKKAFDKHIKDKDAHKV